MNGRLVLVTGAGGFIGSSLVRDQIRRGHRVRAYDMNLQRLEDLEEGDSCELIHADIRDLDTLARQLVDVDVVFHLAAAHLEVGRSDTYFWSVNLHAVGDLLRLSDDAGVNRFVHCSSVGVFGSIACLPADESTPCHPDIVYEQTKLAGEHAVASFTPSSGMERVILRPAWVYGPGCPRTLKLIKSVAIGRFFFVGDGTNFRHPIYIADMCEAFELAASSADLDGEVFIVAGAKPVRLRQLVEAVAAAVGKTPRFPTLPHWLVRPVCRTMDGMAHILRVEPPFSSRSLKFFSESSAFDVGHARTRLGFEPRYGLEQGLLETLDYYRQHQLI